MIVYSAFPHELLLQDYCFKILFLFVFLPFFYWKSLLDLAWEYYFLSSAHSYHHPSFWSVGGRKGRQRRWFQHFQPNGRKQEYFGKLIRSIGELVFIPPFVKPGDFFFQAFNVECNAYTEFDQRWHSYSNCWIKHVNDLPRLTQQFTKKTDLHKTGKKAD